LIISVTKFYKFHLKLAIWVFFPLIFAGSIYIFFRSHNTLINLLLSNFFEIPELQSNNYWLVYCLPGGLWLFSFQMAIYLFIQSQKNFLVIFSLLFTLGIEYVQFLHITDGFFDWLDVYTYLIFSALSFFIFFLKKQLYPIISQSNHSFKYFIFAFFCGIVFLSDLF